MLITIEKLLNRWSDAILYVSYVHTDTYEIKLVVKKSLPKCLFLYKMRMAYENLGCAEQLTMQIWTSSFKKERVPQS